jgi:transcriptional regulator with XRE-family HTH domain
MATRTQNMSPTPLAIFVRERLAELEIRQSDFCRLSMFDQGLLSKIQNSVVTSLSLESVLKLAVGLSVPPQRILNLLDRMDMHDLVIKSYASEFSDMVTDNLREDAPEIADRLRAALKEAAGKLSLENGKTRRRRWQSNHLNKAVKSAETGA